MAQFDVHRNTNPASKKRYPLLLDIQSDLLDDLATRVVVPLAMLEERSAPSITRLMPVLEVEGRQLTLHTAQLASVARKTLGPQVASLAVHREDIVAALDVLISGV